MISLITFIPWYVAGPLIALFMFFLLWMGKNFGLSSNLRTLCSACGADGICEFFCFDWKAQRWNLYIMLGALVGGLIASQLMPTEVVHINPDTVSKLQELGFASAGTSYLPTEIYSISALSEVKSWVILICSGLLIGFGARYAGGCTSGHAISGLSNLQLPSLIAVIGFFIGGLLMVHILFPIIF